jgi:L-alanine-DL-glutamate epimerase-like enolase superfamily enzyme
MAVLDWQLRRDGERFGDEARSDQAVGLNVTVSILDHEWVEDVGGYSRTRLKTFPEAPLGGRVAQLVEWGLPVLLDFNASATSDRDVEEQVRLLERSGLAVTVEQPFAVGDYASCARLVRESSVRLSLDESIRSVPDLRHAARVASASEVCVKVARVGEWRTRACSCAKPARWVSPPTSVASLTRPWPEASAPP